jgi:AAHS family 4-hydroxybenzoate transporter-like MFS transporter
MYALAAHVYPVEIRSRGVGTAVAVGRIGNALASYVGIYALNTGGAPGYFSTWAVTMTLTLISLAIVGRHIPKLTARAASAYAPVRH